MKSSWCLGWSASQNGEHPVSPPGQLVGSGRGLEDGQEPASVLYKGRTIKTAII